MAHHYVRYIELSEKHRLVAKIVVNDYINGETIRMQPK